MPHFLDLDQLPASELRAILDYAHARKAARGRDWPKGRPDADAPLAGHVLAMLFEKPSTRTRVSFDIAMRQMGGGAVLLDGHGSQIGHGETIADTAQVLSRYVDAIMLRTNAPRKLLELASHSAVPVINGLTDASHPCQIMADLMAVEEKLGRAAGKRVAWVGDGNNVAASWIHACAKFGFELTMATPQALQPPDTLMEWARREGAAFRLTRDPRDAVRGADVVVTDCWVSMGFEEGDRHTQLEPYRVDEALMAEAAAHAVFMHCLPAHRDEEVTAGVIDGPQSIVFDEAENRIHAQKAILAWCLGKL